MASAKPNQKIHVDQLEATLAELDQLEEKQKEELTLRESIYFLRDKLKRALKKGYSYQDLSEILEEQGILISAATLKQYLTESNKKAASRKRGGKSGQSQRTYPKVSEKTVKTSKESVPESKEDSKSSSVKSESEESQEINPANDTEKLPDDEIKLSEENHQASSRESQRGTRKTVRAKQKRLSSSNPDLSREFNQY